MVNEMNPEASPLALSAAGIGIGGKGQTSVRRSDRTGSGRRIDRSHPASVVGLPMRREGEALRRTGRADPASPETKPRPVRADDLWEVFLSADNLARALRHVEVNRGAPGPDGNLSDRSGRFRGNCRPRPRIAYEYP
jgi:hypothetical protein